MKKQLTACLIILAFHSGIRAQNEKTQTITPGISGVTVYLEGAEISHLQSVNLAAGRTLILFQGLSSKLDPKSIRMTTGSGISVLSITSRVNYLTKSSEKPRIKQLRDSLGLVTSKIQLLADEKAALTLEKEMLLKNQAIGGQSNGVAVAELQKAADFYYSRIFEIGKRLSQIELQTAELNLALGNLNNEMNEVNAAYNYALSEISVLVSAETPVTREIELKYYVSDCGWTPYYDLKAEDVGQPINITYMAKVFNNTGIDWSNMNMILSTADPTMSATQPILQPWGLDYSSAYDFNADGEFNQRVDNGVYKGNQKTKQQGNVIYEEIEVSQLSVEFIIKPSYSIPADSRPYIVEVSMHTLPATYKYICVPKLDRDAFLLARITGWEDLDLLEAPVNIFFGGSFVGESYIYTRNVNDTLDISLGRDKKVLVTRTKIKDYSSEPFIGTKRKETYRYDITAKNNRKVPVSIEIQDQLPVSENSEIEVNVENISKAQHNVLTGILKWNFVIDPGKSETMQLAYSVKYPRNKSLRPNGQEQQKRYRAARFL